MPPSDFGLIIRTRTLIWLIVLAVSLSLSGCGGGSSSGSGGGGGGSSISLTLLSPTSITTGVPLGGVGVYGHGFDHNSQVLIDGVPAQTTFLDAGTLVAQVTLAFGATAGVHQFKVQGASGAASNSLPLTVYNPQQGPLVMKTAPGFLVGDYSADPSFIVAADLNGDGLSDVILPGPGPDPRLASRERTRTWATRPGAPCQ